MATKRKPLKQPKPKTFTDKQLEEWYGWSQADIESYVRTGKLRQAFDTATRPDLRDSVFYKCEADDKQLLDAIKDLEPLSAFTSSIIQENFISCPPYLYLPIAFESFEFCREWMMSTLIIYGELPEELLDQSILLRYFYDFEGNALIPMLDDKLIGFPMVKFQFRRQLIFPIKEVEKFRIENTPERKGKGDREKTKILKDEIIEIIKDLGYDPKSFPHSGKPRSPELLEILRSNPNFKNRKITAKTEVWEEYILRLSKKEKDPHNRPLSKFFWILTAREKGRLKHAWQDLIEDDKITNKKKPETKTDSR